MFSKGSGRQPQFAVDQLTVRLGEEWKTEKVRIKPYAAMAATHGTIDCVRKLQENYPEEMKDLEGIESVRLSMGEVAFHHGGFKVERPLSSVGAQMSCAYVAATQMVDGEVMPREFRSDMLERDAVWQLVDKITCVQAESEPENKWKTVAEVIWKDGRRANVEVMAARGVDPELSNEEIVEKWRSITRNVIDDERAAKIEKACLGIEELEDVKALEDLLVGISQNPIQ